MTEKLSQLNNFENKRVNFELDVEGIKIPCWKENFSYPENIQKETQIEGYEKIKVYKNNLEKADIDFNKLLESFSHGNFPNKTYNHVMYADHSYPISYLDTNVHEKFAKNGFLLGKIDTVQFPEINPNHLFGGNIRTVKLILDQNKGVENVGQIIENPKSNDVNIFKYNGMIENNDSGFAESNDFANQSQKLFSEEEYSEVLKQKIILDSINGLNVLTGRVWADNFTRPFFGFDPKESPFKEYLEKINKIYGVLPENMVGKVNKESIRAMLSGDLSKNVSFMPIMTGNTGLPELRWGHCKYAVIPTSDTINLITVKHLITPTNNER